MAGGPSHYCSDNSTGQSFCCALKAMATSAREHRCYMICAVRRPADLGPGSLKPQRSLYREFRTASQPATGSPKALGEI